MIENKNIDGDFGRMRDLRASYLSRLGGQLAAVEEFMRRMRGGYATITDFAEISFLAHKMAGTAGTFGFMSLSDAAHTMERAIAVHERGAAEALVMASAEQLAESCRETLASAKAGQGAARL